MLAMIRRYEHVTPSVARSVIDARHQVAALLGVVPGAHGSLLVRTRDSLVLLALGTDEWCLTECGRRFRGWADENHPGFPEAGEAAIWVGEAFGSLPPLPTPGSDGADPPSTR